MYHGNTSSITTTVQGTTKIAGHDKAQPQRKHIDKHQHKRRASKDFESYTRTPRLTLQTHKKKEILRERKDDD
jgi:hypothetical protein